MKVVFRADASVAMGSGHLMRCATLAHSLRGRGAQVRFVCRRQAGDLTDLLRSRTFPVTVLPAARNGGASAGGYAEWLGVAPAEDAAQTLAVLAGERPDWLIVDHYALDAEWERPVRAQVGKLMVIDDLADRKHECDLLLDQNYSIESEQRYAGLVPDACRLLVGPHYALLQPEYAACRKVLAVRHGQVQKVLVFFGGSDPQNMTGKALDALSRPGLRHLEVDVVAGISNPHRAELERRARERPRTRIHGPLAHLADLMARADLALGAGGSTMWERMCLGLPSIVVSIAENQRPACRALSQAGLVEYAGHFDELTTNRLEQCVQAAVERPARLAQLAAQSSVHVDGLGALRLAEALYWTPERELMLRPAREDDLDLYFAWANDPEVRRNSIDSSPIAWTEHNEWFAAKMADRNSHLFVLEAAGLPVGQIRFDQCEGEVRLDYSLDPLVRGRRWGQCLVRLGIDQMARIGSVSILAEVKPENRASAAVLLRLGFAEAAAPDGGLRHFRIECGGSGKKEGTP